MLEGFYDTDNQYELEKYSKEIWNILQNSYKNIGGFLTYSNIDDMLMNTSFSTLYFKDNRLVSCAIYKNALGGEKMVGCGTLNGSKEEKLALHKIVQNDINEFSKWHWAEVSGGVERLFKKYNGNPIPNILAPTILRRPKMQLVFDKDGSHYKRDINGSNISKIIYGFNSQEIYDKVENEIYQLTGFDSYEAFKKEKNELPAICESHNYLKNHMNNRIAFSMEVLIQLDYIYRDNAIRELPYELYECFVDAISRLNGYIEPDFKIKMIAGNAKNILKNMTILRNKSFSRIEKYLFYPAI